MQRWLTGALAGVVATGPMTAVMYGGKAIGLLRVPPPKQVTASAESKAHPSLAVSPALAPGWLAAHVGFGALCGVGYAWLRGLLPGQVAVAGALYGGAIWGGAYLFALPALGLYPSALEDSRSRQAVMIAAHEVFGLSLAGLVRRLAG